MTSPRLLAIHVGRPAQISHDGQSATSSINKQRVEGPVMVRRLNIDGDEQADLKVHGGVDKAVYCYPAEHYPVWSAELGRELAHGSFGENLTVEGLTEDWVRVGDVLAIGDAVLQVSEPRRPCFKLGIKFGDQRFVATFLDSGRSGFYCRVLQEGLIEAGQEIRLGEKAQDGPTIASLVAEPA